MLASRSYILVCLVGITDCGFCFVCRNLNMSNWISSKRSRAALEMFTRFAVGGLSIGDRMEDSVGKKMVGGMLSDNVNQDTPLNNTSSMLTVGNPVLVTQPEEIECIPEIKCCLLIEDDDVTNIKLEDPKDLSVKVCDTSQVVRDNGKRKHILINHTNIRKKKKSTVLSSSKSRLKGRKTRNSDADDDKKIEDISSQDLTARVSEGGCNSFSRSKQYILRNGMDSAEDKPFACDLCDARFSKKCKVKDHRRIHTGERPYACSVCGAAFSHRCGLYKHRKTHSGERPHTCDTCGVGFAQNSYLTRHKRTHSGEKPFPCDACNTRFPDNASLKRHRRVHSGEKPYVCSVCDATFSRSNYLVLHKRTHSGEKPYQCDVCTAQFSQKNNLVRHKKMHSGNESSH